MKSKEQKLSISLPKLYQLSRMKYYEFENTIGGCLGIPSTVEKPEFEVIIRIKK